MKRGDKIFYGIMWAVASFFGGLASYYLFNERVWIYFAVVFSAVLGLIFSLVVLTEEAPKHTEPKKENTKVVPSNIKKSKNVNNAEQFKTDALFSVTGNPYVKGTVRYMAYEEARYVR